MYFNLPANVYVLDFRLTDYFFLFFLNINAAFALCWHSIYQRFTTCPKKLKSPYSMLPFELNSKQYSLHKFTYNFFYFVLCLFLFTPDSYQIIIQSHRVKWNEIHLFTHISHNHFRFRRKTFPMWIQKGNIIHCATWIPTTYLVSTRKLLKGCLECKPAHLLFYFFKRVIVDPMQYIGKTVHIL